MKFHVASARCSVLAVIQRIVVLARTRDLRMVLWTTEHMHLIVVDGEASNVASIIIL